MNINYNMLQDYWFTFPGVDGQKEFIQIPDLVDENHIAYNTIKNNGVRPEHMSGEEEKDHAIKGLSKAVNIIAQIFVKTIKDFDSRLALKRQREKDLYFSFSKNLTLLNNCTHEKEEDQKKWLETEKELTRAMWHYKTSWEIAERYLNSAEGKIQGLEQELNLYKRTLELAKRNLNSAEGKIQGLEQELNLYRTDPSYLNPLERQFN